jgi:hypothetical protein
MKAGVGPALTSDVLVANRRTRRLLPLREHSRSSWLISSLLRTTSESADRSRADACFAWRSMRQEANDADPAE